jgi:hypothetical protein
MISRRVALAALALVLCCALADAKKKKKDLAAESMVCLPTENAPVALRRGAVTAPFCMTAMPYLPAPVTAPGATETENARPG